MLSFDIRGNLTPYGSVTTSLETVEQTFVTPFQNSTRQSLFAVYLRYTTDLKALLGGSFYQWLNGSFSQSIYSPRDIDVVSFIDYKSYAAHEKLIHHQFSKWSAPTLYEGIDAYIVKTYPASHENFVAFQADEAYWYDLFSQTRRDRHRKRHPKGFIRINVD